MIRMQLKKKRILLLALFFLFIFTLTGCITEKNREKILGALKKYDVIKEDWNYLGYKSNDASPIPDISSYSYYYQNEDGIIYEVCLQNKYTGSESESEYYPVSLTDNMEAYENEEVYKDPDYDELQTHIVTRYKSTDVSNTTHFKVSKRKILFFEIWIVRNVQ